MQIGALLKTGALVVLVSWFASCGEAPEPALEESVARTDVPLSSGPIARFVSPEAGFALVASASNSSTSCSSPPPMPSINVSLPDGTSPPQTFVRHEIHELDPTREEDDLFATPFRCPYIDADWVQSQNTTPSVLCPDGVIILNGGDLGTGSWSSFGIVGSCFSRPGRYLITVNMPPDEGGYVDIVALPEQSTFVGRSGSQFGPFSVEVVVPGGAADLSVTLDASPNPVKHGGQITYSATVLNAGPQAATSATVSFALSDGIRFLSIASGRGNCAGAPSPSRLRKNADPGST